MFAHAGQICQCRSLRSHTIPLGRMIEGRTRSLHRRYRHLSRRTRPRTSRRIGPPHSRDRSPSEAPPAKRQCGGPLGSLRTRHLRRGRRRSASGEGVDCPRSQGRLFGCALSRSASPLGQRPLPTHRGPSDGPLAGPPRASGAMTTRPSSPQRWSGRRPADSRPADGSPTAGRRRGPAAGPCASRGPRARRCAGRSLGSGPGR